MILPNFDDPDEETTLLISLPGPVEVEQDEDSWRRPSGSPRPVFGLALDKHEGDPLELV